MKVRTDFVTNSSSSSFIIARHNKCTIGEIADVLSTQREHIKYILDVFDLDCDDNAIKLFIEEMSDWLYSKSCRLQLGDWEISSDWCSNEDDKFRAFMYSFGDELTTENFKVVYDK